MTTDIEAIDGRAEHLAHFYERDEDAVRLAATFVVDAARAGDAVVVIASDHHRRAFRAALEGARVDVAGAERVGRYAAVDAPTLLERVLVDERIDRGRFETAIAPIVGRASATGRAVSAYGEMVGLLWAAGNILAALQLESLWNDLARESPFSMLCTYADRPLSIFAPVNARQHLCELHTSVVGTGSTTVGHVRPETLSDTQVREFSADLSSARAARCFVVDALRARRARGEIVDDAALVVTELATNAIVHTHSPFTVCLAAEDGVVRIAVADPDPRLPEARAPEPAAQSGRGLGLVRALARAWGTDVTPTGKIVWAELPR